ncbi:hypothetical protein [uncultured Fibrella sp.]|uniref:hypothetical protein n=1 Tax=uncultured Fibrella sp. TaxID=1284596 RepID=UPI0035CB80F7
MKTIITALALSLFLSNCQSIRSFVGSVTTIPPAREFNLGGTNQEAFSAFVKNIGAVTVAVSQRSASGTVTTLGQLKPGEKRLLQFETQTTAVFVNASPDNSATLSLELSGDRNLSMGYAGKK